MRAMADTVTLVAGEEYRERIAAQLPLATIEETWRRTLLENPAVGRGVLVAQAEGEVVGFASFLAPDPGSLEGKESPGSKPIAPGLPYEVPRGSAHILAFEVDHRQRNRGHGSRLLSAIADTATAQGIPGLLVWIVGEDESRVRFFQKAGFAPVGMRRSLDTGAGILTEHLWFAALA